MEFRVNHPILYIIAGFLVAVVLAPIALILVLFVFIPGLNEGTVGIMVPVSALFTIGVGRILYKRGVL